MTCCTCPITTGHIRPVVAFLFGFLIKPSLSLFWNHLSPAFFSFLFYLFFCFFFWLILQLHFFYTLPPPNLNRYRIQAPHDLLLWDVVELVRHILRLQPPPSHTPSSTSSTSSFKPSISLH